MTSLRTIARLAGLLLLVAVTVAGIAAVVFSIQDSPATLSFTWLARELGLVRFDAFVGDRLRRLEAGDSIAPLSALIGAGLVVAGLGLLAGALARGREKLLVLEQQDDGGRVAARRTAVADLAVATARHATGVSDATARVTVGRSGKGGRLALTAFHPRRADAPAVEQAARGELETLTAPFHLRTSVTAAAGRGKRRVQ